MKCANCKKDAFYIYQMTEKTQVLYCNVHLPTFLENAKNAGLLKTTDSFKSVIEEGLKNIVTPKVEITPVEEPVVDKLQDEEETTEEPKKKATKKKAE
jgi:hypothetical protein